jgi:hypothetical protein
VKNSVLRAASHQAASPKASLSFPQSSMFLCQIVMNQLHYVDYSDLRSLFNRFLLAGTLIYVVIGKGKLYFSGFKLRRLHH